MKLAMPLEAPRKTFDEEGVLIRDISLQCEQWRRRAEQRWQLMV